MKEAHRRVAFRLVLLVAVWLSAFTVGRTVELRRHREELRAILRECFESQGPSVDRMGALPVRARLGQGAPGASR